MAKYIVQHRRGTAEQWASHDTIIPKEGELVIEIDEDSSLHKLKIGDGIHKYSELAYLMAGDEIVTQVLSKAQPRVVTVTLDVNQWAEITCETDPNLGYYGQTVVLDGITEYSRLDLQPSADMLAEFQRLNLVFVAENKGGTITVYSVGDMPLKSYTMQATIIETEVIENNEKIIGTTVGTPASSVGKFTSEGGEIFNDYVNNKTYAENTHVEGVNNSAGSLAFKVVSYDESARTYTLDGDISEIQVGDYYSARLYDITGGCNAVVNVSTITEVDVATSTITVDKFYNLTKGIYCDGVEIDGEVLYSTIRIARLDDTDDTRRYPKALPHIGNIPIGGSSHTGGVNNKSIEVCSFATGQGNVADGSNSFATGKNNVADFCAFVAGERNYSGKQSATFGKWNKTGENAFAVGKQNNAMGLYSFASGLENNADGKGSFVSGHYNQAKGENSTSFGAGNIAELKDQMTVGRYNSPLKYEEFSINSFTNGGYYKYKSISFLSVTDDGALTWKIKSGRTTVYAQINKNDSSNLQEDYYRIYPSTTYKIICKVKAEYASQLYLHLANSSGYATKQSARAEIQASAEEQIVTLNVTTPRNLEYDRFLLRATSTQASDVYFYLYGVTIQATQSILFTVGNGTSDTNRSNAFDVFEDGHTEVGVMGSTDLSVATKGYVDQMVSIGTLVDLFYPIDSIYISSSETNPFKDYGIWESIEDERFFIWKRIS